MSEETLGEGIIPNILYDQNGNDIYKSSNTGGYCDHIQVTSAAQPSIISPMTADIATPITHGQIMGFDSNSEFAQKWSKEILAVRKPVTKWVWDMFGDGQSMVIHLTEDVGWFRRKVTSWLFGSVWTKP